MDGNPSGGESDNFGWDTEDELEIENLPFSSCSSLTVPGRETNAGSGEMSSSSGSSSSKLMNHFVGMGFSEKMVLKVIEENGEGNTESILEALLTYSTLENSPESQGPEQQQHVDSDLCSTEYDESFLDDFSDTDSWPGNEENTTSLTDKDKTLLTLANMGYTVEEASIAMDRCGVVASMEAIPCFSFERWEDFSLGPEASLVDLTDFICAAQMSKAADANLPDENKPKVKDILNENGRYKKRKFSDYDLWKRRKQKGHEKKILGEDDETIRLPNPMVGFGVPTEPYQVNERNIPEAAVGPPYFYYENVALAPKGVWDTISRFLYDVDPEFVDSKYFCAAARKRGYVHNLPIHNRFPLLPLPPRTIHDALPLTRKWWPSWDTRMKLNCLQTVIGSAKMTDRIRKALEEWDGEPPLAVQKYVLEECRKWNLVWVGRNKVAPLEPDEIEMLLGFPKNHTRGGISRTDRYKSLGNSFQVDTVAYHLSVMKDLFPGGINLLSLFSGIGGAEVALHRLGVPLKNVVSVEISEVNRNIVRSWWEQTNQKGNLIDLTDVQQLNADRLEELMNSFGGFDLVVGGSPCNNLAGSNRVSRDGLEGEHSALFYDYFRILDLVKCIMGKQQ